MDTIPSLYDAFDAADELGPYEVVHVAKRTAGLRAIVVVDNLARGPALTPVRMTLDGTTDEALRMARGITLASALGELPFGGGAILLEGDATASLEAKQEILEALAAAVAPLKRCIILPGTGIDPIGFTRLSPGRDIDGEALALAKAAGLAAAVTEGARGIGLKLSKARFGIDGFGRVGRALARMLVARGAQLVAVSDHGGLVVSDNGLDVDRIALLGRPHDAGRNDMRSHVAPGCPPADIWIANGRARSLDVPKAAGLGVRLVAEATFGAISRDASDLLQGRGVLVLPDLLIAGGSLLAAADAVAPNVDGPREADALVTALVRRVLRDARARRLDPRIAAASLAIKRIPRPRRRR